VGICVEQPAVAHFAVGAGSSAKQGHGYVVERVILH
jgi:hypothetical protein